MRRRGILVVIGMLVLLVGGFVLRIYWLAGEFRTVEPHFAGTCRLVDGPVGPEDLTIHPQTGIAYISAYDRRARMAGAPVPGAIFAYDLNTPDARPVNLTPDAGVALQPHGISLWVGEDGHEALYVINHPARSTGLPTHTVEVFDLKGGALVHRTSLSGPLLVTPNDLVAVGFDRFYLTNTHKYPPGWRQTLETFLQLPGANVVYYAGGRFRPAIENLVLPNGINVSHDGRTLYVATTTEQQLRVYDRDPATEHLTLRSRIDLDGGPDNIELDADGNLWIGTHPKLLTLQAHRDDPSVLSPSLVLRVSDNGSGGYRVDPIYSNRGEQLSGSSVAARYGDRLLIGQIFGNGFLDCVMGTDR